MHAGAVASAIVAFLVSFSFTHRIFHSDVYWDNVLFSALMASLIYGYLCQKEQQRQEAEENRLSAFRATMRTVQSIFGDFLNNIQFLRSTSEQISPEESSELFDHLIVNARRHLRALSELEEIKEKPMAIGMGIDYPLPHPLPKSFGSDVISSSAYSVTHQ